jgi:telomerase reverse transcriptase
MTDVLNRFPNSRNLADTVHVMKYIFPRQFGLHNVFTSIVDSRETVQPFKDYTLREDEIARSKVTQGSRFQQVIPKIPKRLRGGLLQLVQRLQKRSETCSYTELLRHYCPISVSFAYFPSMFAVD